MIDTTHSTAIFFPRAILHQDNHAMACVSLCFLLTSFDFTTKAGRVTKCKRECKEEERVGNEKRPPSTHLRSIFQVPTFVTVGRAAFEINGMHIFYLVQGTP
jgi:hypothetical protein